MKKICCILNYPSHYRENIYIKMEEGLDCDFYFGNIDEGKIKKIDYSSLNNGAIELRTKKIPPIFNWISKSVRLSFKKKYDRYILTGDIFCISNWMILLFNRLQGKKTYLWTHGWYGDESSAKRIIKKVFFKLSNGLFLYGDYAKRLMQEEGFSENKLHVIYNSLNYDNQKKVREELHESDVCDKNFKEKLPVIIFTGRLTAVKKLEYLIRAHKKLIDSGSKVNVIFIGDGPARNSLEKLIKDLSTEEFYYFYGECYDEKLIGEFYYNSILCVSPGNVGLTSIHAMTYGCPVISHSNLSQQMPEFEVIEVGKTGDFFEENNIDSLAGKIDLWIKGNYPKSTRIIQNCYDVIDNKFNPDYQMSIFKKVLL